MNFSEKMQDFIKKGIEASKDFVSKATDQAQTWGEMGVLKVEILQLKSQAEKMTAALGAEVYAALAERGEPAVSVGNTMIREIVGKIKEVETLIDGKEEKYRKLGGKDSDLDPEPPKS